MSELSSTEILKTDTKGRMRMSAARREAILDEFEKSSVSGAVFAKMVGIKYQTFASWVQKRRKARENSSEASSAVSSTPMRFAEAMIAEEISENVGMIVELPGGAKVRVQGNQQLELLCHLLIRLAKKDPLSC